MPARGDSTSLARLRAAVAAQVAAVGLRPVARQIGMDPKSVTDFVNGATPRSATRQKLERWYVQCLARTRGAVAPDAARAALHVLVQDLAPAHREEAVRAAIDLWVEVYRRFETPPPRWLEALRQP